MASPSFALFKDSLGAINRGQSFMESILELLTPGSQRLSLEQEVPDQLLTRAVQEKCARTFLTQLLHRGSLGQFVEMEERLQARLPQA